LTRKDDRPSDSEKRESEEIEGAEDESCLDVFGKKNPLRDDVGTSPEDSKKREGDGRVAPVRPQT